MSPTIGDAQLGIDRKVPIDVRRPTVPQSSSLSTPIGARRRPVQLLHSICCSWRSFYEQRGDPVRAVLRTMLSDYPMNAASADCLVGHGYPVTLRPAKDDVSSIVGDVRAAETTVRIDLKASRSAECLSDIRVQPVDGSK